MATGITIVVNQAPAGPSADIQQVSIVSAPDVVPGDETKHLAISTVTPLALAWVASNGGLTAIAVKTANYTAAVGELVPANATGGAFTVTLPTAATATGPIGVKKVDDTDTAITVATTGGQTIDGASTRTLDTPRAGETYYPYGSNWMVM